MRFEAKNAGSINENTIIEIEIEIEIEIVCVHSQLSFSRGRTEYVSSRRRAAY